MPLRAYLAGPDVFLPNAAAHAARKIALCARHGIAGLAPLNDGETSWQAIYRKDLAMMEACDIVIANLTPFRGASADSGTLIEVGWFVGRGRPAFGYSNSATPFLARSRTQIAALPDPLPGISVEGFGLTDNLMIEGAVGGIVVPPDAQDHPFDALQTFEACIKKALSPRERAG